MDPDRPRIPSPEQEGSLEQDLDGMPRQSVLNSSNWNAEMVAVCIRDRFGVSYSRRRPGDRHTGSNFRSESRRSIP